MKILCIGRNYAAHAAELGNAVPEEPLLFIKPDSALMNKDVFHIPDWTQNVHFECELVVQVSKSLTNVREDEAEQSIASVRLGLDFTARDVQDELKKKGYPWEKAKGFDGAAYVSKKQVAYTPGSVFAFTLQQNGQTRQQGDSSLMVTPIARLLAYASRFFTIAPDDYVFTGTPAGVGPVSAGDTLVGSVDSEVVFTVQVEG